MKKISDKLQKELNTFIVYDINQPRMKLGGNIKCAIIAILALIFILMVQQVYYRRQIRLMNERISALADEKNYLQVLLADRGFSSSNTP